MEKMFTEEEIEKFPDEYTLPSHEIEEIKAHNKELMREIAAMELASSGYSEKYSKYAADYGVKYHFEESLMGLLTTLLYMTKEKLKTDKIKQEENNEQQHHK